MLAERNVRRFGVLLCAVVALFTVASSALAEEPDANVFRPRWPAHLRLGVAGQFGGAYAPKLAVGSLSFVGVRVIVGAQVARSLAIYLRGAGGTSVLTTEAGGGVGLELTPIDELSLSAGVGVEGFNTICVPANGNPPCGALGVGAPLAVAYHVLDQRSRRSRKAITFGLEGQPALDLEHQSRPFVAGNLFAGYDWM